MKTDDLVVAHITWIKELARFYCRNVMEAEDLAGETIFRCLRGGKGYDGSRSFKPWVKTIMERLYLTQYNRGKKLMFDCYADWQDVRETHTDQLAKLNEIFSIVRDCSRKSCTIECVMLYAKGYSYDEISTRVNIPVGTVKSRVRSGRMLLRDAFAH